MNILVMLADDLNDWISRPGGAYVPTPSVQQLASRGITFTNAQATATSCGPSRASILTGRLPSADGDSHGTGVCTNPSANRWTVEAVKASVQTLPARLRAHGHWVAGAGKIFHQDSCEFGTSKDATFDEFFHSLPKYRADGSMALYHCGNRLDAEAAASFCECNNHGAQDLLSMMVAAPLELNDSMRLVASAETSRRDWHWTERQQLPDDRTTRWVTEFLSREGMRQGARRQPFALFVGLHHPHDPYAVPPQTPHPRIVRLDSAREADDLQDLPLEALRLIADRRGKRGAEDELRRLALNHSAYFDELRPQIEGYLAAVAHMDTNVGQIMGAVDRAGLGNTTAILFTSDHGAHLGEKLHFSKWTLWERVGHVPLILVLPPTMRALPGGTLPPPASTFDDPVSLVDIFPTVAELAGIRMGQLAIEHARPLHGLSLLGAVAGLEHAYPPNRSVCHLVECHLIAL